MQNTDISSYTIERRGTTVQEALVLQSAPILIENKIAGAAAQIGTRQLDVYDYTLEHLSTNAFRLLDVDRRDVDATKTLEVVRIEPQGRQVTWRAQRWGVLHPTLDTGTRQQSLLVEIRRPFGGPAAAPINLLRLTLPQVGNTAGKLAMVGVYADGTSWFEEHAFRLAIGGARPVNQAFQLHSTETGLEDNELVDRREWVSLPEVGSGLVYRWTPNAAARDLVAPLTITASIHLFVQTFGPSNVAPVRIQVLDDVVV